MGQKKKMQRIVSGCMAIFLLMSSNWQAKADIASDPGNTQQLVGGFVSILSLAGPEGAAAAMVAGEMKDVMNMLGFFKSADPVGQALQQINARLDAIEQRLDQTDQRIQAVQNQVFQNANLQNTRLLRDQRNAIQRVLTGLKDKPTDKFTKDQLALQAQQVCDTFLTDQALWMYSDMAAKNITWNGQNIQAGTMMPAEFKPAPTLEVYATALAAYMAAIEYASNGDTNSVKSNYTTELNRNIAFLSTRSNFNKFQDTPQSLPEQIVAKIKASYVPTSRYPDAQRVCVIAEYIIDDFARDQKLVGNESYVAQSANEMCTVPAGLLNRESPTETTLENSYGLDVMALLVEKLTHLRNQGTIREQYIGTFTPTTVSGDYLYKVKPDGHLYWQGDNEQISAIKPGETGTLEHMTHALTQESQLPYTWAKYEQIIPGGGSTFYTQKDGSLGWFSHDGSLTGAPTLRGPIGVGSGWGALAVAGFVPMGNGVLYVIKPNGTLTWYKHKNYRTGTGATPAWAPPVDVGSGWTGNKFVFGGGHGVIYVVTNDGKLNWYKHDYMNPAPLPIPAMWLALPPSAAQAMQNGLRLAWQKTWQGPKLVGTGWSNFTKLFCAGNGHIYGVLPNGELRAYDHVGWQDGSFRWGDSQKIADGWGDNQFVWARMPSDDEDAPVVH